jgi:DNA invertase Pin-like site-specific DNA recombinase
MTGCQNLDDLRRMVLDLTKKGLHARFVKEFEIHRRRLPDVEPAVSLLAAVAEFERSMIRERQREGIALAKKNGVYKGSNPSLTEMFFDRLDIVFAAQAVDE